jgi:hypothetical protein
MENPFLLAIALWESREVTTRLLAGAKENEPDSRLERERPIDWRLLAGDVVQPEGHQSASNPGRPRKRGALRERDLGEGGRTKCLEHVTRGSCA